MEKSKGIYMPDAKADVWRIIGNCEKLGNWEPSSSLGKMKQVVKHFFMKSVNLPPGKYEFKFVKNGHWEESIGSRNGGNFSFVIQEETRVQFFLNDELNDFNKIRISLSGLEGQGILPYVPHLPEDRWPRLVGDFQREVGGGENWAPLSSNLRFVDYYFNGVEYRLNIMMDPGIYQCKVVFGDSWDCDSSGDNGNNYSFEVVHMANVEFTVGGNYPYPIKTTQYPVTDTTKRIDRDFLLYDGQSPIFKKPFGAIPMMQEEVTFRFQTKRYNVEMVKLDLMDTKGKSSQFPMKVVDTIAKWDYWEVTVPKEAFYEEGIWKYQFILLNGNEKIEYRNADRFVPAGPCFGGTFSLTVYGEDFFSGKMVSLIEKEKEEFSEAFLKFVRHGDAKKLADEVLRIQDICPREVWIKVFRIGHLELKNYTRYLKLFKDYEKAEEIVERYSDIFCQGEHYLVYAKGDVIVFARKSKKRGAIIAVNRGNEKIAVVGEVGDFFYDGMIFVDEISYESRAKIWQGKVKLNIPAYNAVVMISEQEFGGMPQSPSSLWADVIAGVGGSIRLFWEAADGAETYEVYRTYLSGMDWKLIRETDGLEFEDREIENGISYVYGVRAKIGGRKSAFSNLISACSDYQVGHLTKPSEVPDLTLGVGNATDDIFVDVAIPGLTDNPHIANRGIRELRMSLLYSYEGGLEEKEIPMQYSQDIFIKGIISKRYVASFEPTYYGTYGYYAKVDLNHGSSIAYSKATNVYVEKPDVPFCLKIPPVLFEPMEHSNYVVLNWICKENYAEGFFVTRSVCHGEKEVIASLSKEETSFTDYKVCNDCLHEYEVVAYDAYYHRLASNAVSVTPKLHLVDVTIQLVIPESQFLSTEQKYYIACDANGWKADGWKMTPKAIGANEWIYEYQITMIGGEKLEYKFTRGTWGTEAMTSPAREGRDSTEDYGFSFISSNLSFMVEDQGENKMFIKHYVVRWMDCPFILKEPMVSYEREDLIILETKEESLSVKGKVPFGVGCSIRLEEQGALVDVNEMYNNAVDEFGNVYIEEIPLKLGENMLELHIKPLESAVLEGWFPDQGQKQNVTDFKKLCVVRQEDE